MTDQFVVDCYFVGKDVSVHLQNRRLKFAPAHLEILSPEPDQPPRIVPWTQFEYKVVKARKQQLVFPFLQETQKDYSGVRITFKPEHEQHIGWVQEQFQKMMEDSWDRQTPPEPLPHLGQSVSRSDAIDSFTNAFRPMREEPDTEPNKSNHSQNASPMDFEPRENPVERLAEKEKEIEKAKNEIHLRTCHCFDLEERRLLQSNLRGIPNLKMSLHNPKGSKTFIQYTCDNCAKKKDAEKTSELQNPAKRAKIDNLSSSPNQHSQPSLPAPTVCKMCSEFTNSRKNAENELKISQDRQKELENELSDLKEKHEKELTDLKGDHEKELVKEIKDTVKALKEIEELQKTILKLTDENETNEKIIEKLFDRITNVSTTNKNTN